MADNPMPPVVPQLTTPVPQRTDPENFSVRMDLTLFELPLVIDGINAASVYVQGAKMDVASMEGIRDQTYAARDATQVIRDATDQVRLDAITQLDALADDKLLIMDGRIEAVEGIRDDANQAATAAAAYAEAAGQAAGLPEFLEGTEGKPMTRMRDGSGVHFSQEFTPFITVTSTTQLVAGERYRVDTSTGVFNLPLPASPFTGATVWLFDAKGTWKSSPPILNRNGRSIMGLNEDMELNVDNASTGFVFDGTNWRVLA